jgi:hypothetical protein
MLEKPMQVETFSMREYDPRVCATGSDNHLKWHKSEYTWPMSFFAADEMRPGSSREINLVTLVDVESCSLGRPECICDSDCACG